jgi:hypothetical protein
MKYFKHKLFNECLVTWNVVEFNISYKILKIFVQNKVCKIKEYLFLFEVGTKGKLIAYHRKVKLILYFMYYLGGQFQLFCLL